jgi:hypothetical protein
MMLSFRNLRDDERGMSLVFVSVGFMAFLSATTLAIDVGMFMTARSQAQNAADAGALAGAVALVRNSYTDRSPGGPVVQSAINTAVSNDVMHGVPTVEPADVTFPKSPSGQDNRVQVTAHRPALPTLLGQFFGVPTVDINATAVGEAAPANAMTCVKPFMIPDKWIEKQTPAWDPEDEYNKYGGPPKRLPLADPDVYILDGETRTGYSYKNDIGLELKLRAGSGENISPSFYFSWKMPGDTGGDFYRENIANCNTSTIVRGTKIIQEPGNMQGPTIQGIEELIAKDPNAYWDTSCNCVKGSSYTGQSPRLFPIPLYDPEYYADGKAGGRVADFIIANFLGFFVTSVQGNAIHGRVATIIGMVDGEAPLAPDDSLTWAIRLVQ